MFLLPLRRLADPVADPRLGHPFLAPVVGPVNEGVRVGEDVAGEFLGVETSERVPPGEVVVKGHGCSCGWTATATQAYQHVDTALILLLSGSSGAVAPAPSKADQSDKPPLCHRAARLALT